MPKKECVGCGQEFVPKKRIDQQYCSERCRKRKNNHNDLVMRKGCRHAAKVMEQNVRALRNYVKDNPKRLKTVFWTDLEKYGFNRYGPFIIYRETGDIYYLIGEYKVRERSATLEITTLGTFAPMIAYQNTGFYTDSFD